MFTINILVYVTKKLSDSDSLKYIMLIVQFRLSKNQIFMTYTVYRN